MHNTMRGRLATYNKKKKKYTNILIQFLHRIKNFSKKFLIPIKKLAIIKLQLEFKLHALCST